REVAVDADGHFELWPLAPGDYFVRITFEGGSNDALLLLPVYYPGVLGKTAASIVHVEEGQSKDVELFLPARPTSRKVQVLAVDRNGRPMPAIKIELEDMRRPGEVESDVRIGLDKDGKESLTISSGYSYHLHAGSLESGHQGWCSKPVLIAAGATPVQARFV